MMKSDIKLDAENEGWVTVDSHVMKVKSSDFMLDNDARRGDNGEQGHRRALVHNENDGLTINFNGDYPGGVTVNGRLSVDKLTVSGRLQLQAIASEGPALPKKGRVGELIVVENSAPAPGLIARDVSLWICIGKIRTVGHATEGEADDVFWQQVSVGPPVAGTLDD
jgi:hypothetical protein